MKIIKIRSHEINTVSPSSTYSYARNLFYNVFSSFCSFTHRNFSLDAPNYNELGNKNRPNMYHFNRLSKTGTKGPDRTSTFFVNIFLLI